MKNTNSRLIFVIVLSTFVLVLNIVMVVNDNSNANKFYQSISNVFHQTVFS